MLSTYAAARWFRPGSGWYHEQMLAILRKHGYHCVLGTIYPLDTLQPASWLVQKMILAMAKPARIIILHDGGRRGQQTAQSSAAALPIVQQRGYRICPLSQISAPANK